MELKCPQCGKWMAVSQEELLIHDCQVVCPQCLAVCLYEGGELVVRDDSYAPYRHNAAVESDKREVTKFCHSCGKKLPEGISFCPYCGVDLSAPFESPDEKKEEPVQPAAPVQPKKPVEPAKQEKPAETRPQPEKKPRPQREPGVEEKLRTVAHHYSGMRPRMHDRDEMPSKGFKIFAYITILLLIILLVGIVIAGSSIEPAV